MAKDLLRNLQAPALATMLAKAGAPATRSFDPFARYLPHEAWLEQRLHGKGQSGDNAPTPTVDRMQRLGLSVTEGTWFLLNPVHIHIARDHLVLTDRRRLPLEESESRALFEAALPAFAESGKTIVYGTADTWFVRADDWQTLETTTPDAACGHNIDIWMPKGEGERAWRKLQNEVQMEWHEHPANGLREERREPPVNSLWLWGGAKAGQSAPAAAYFDDTSDLAALLAQAQQPVVIALDALSEPALAEEWGGWLERMQLLDERWFAPLLTSLQRGEIAQLTLISGHNAALREFKLTPRALLKFWAKPSFSRLMP
ncbi:MAG TPA: hypothetical protein VIF60_04785 [Burkholderiaceae bacterium]